MGMHPCCSLGDSRSQKSAATDPSCGVVVCRGQGVHAALFPGDQLTGLYVPESSVTHDAVTTAPESSVTHKAVTTHAMVITLQGCDGT
jgi:hypothetical protein